MLSVKERSDQRISKLKIGDKVESFLDGTNVIGTLVSINDRKGKIETKYGVFNCDLVSTYHIAEDPENYADSKCTYGYMTVCKRCVQEKRTPKWVDISKPIKEIFPMSDKCENCGASIVSISRHY